MARPLPPRSRRRSRALADPLRRHPCRQHRKSDKDQWSRRIRFFSASHRGCLHRRRALRTMMRSAVEGIRCTTPSILWVQIGDVQPSQIAVSSGSMTAQHGAPRGARQANEFNALQNCLVKKRFKILADFPMTAEQRNDELPKGPQLVCAEAPYCRRGRPIHVQR